MCKTSPCKCLNCLSSKNCKALGLLGLRIAIGIIFISHGYGKLFGNAPGMEMFTGMVAGLGFPLPALFAYLVALTEFLGGFAVLLGVCARFFSILIGIVMLVALVAVKKFSFPAGDVDLALLMITVALATSGPGMYSLATMMGKHDENGCCKDEDHKHEQASK